MHKKSGPVNITLNITIVSPLVLTGFVYFNGIYYRTVIGFTKNLDPSRLVTFVASQDYNIDRAVSPFNQREWKRSFLSCCLNMWLQLYIFRVEHYLMPVVGDFGFHLQQIQYPFLRLQKIDTPFWTYI